MIKILLVATVVSSFMIDEIGQITNFDSSQILTVAVLMIELVFVFGAHSWVRLMAYCVDSKLSVHTQRSYEPPLACVTSLTQLKNIMGGLMALIDEQIKSGSHIRFQGHEGVVERLYLQCFSLRQYDKGLTYIPNGILLENTVEIQSKNLDRRCVVAVHLSHRTKATVVRLFIQELDNFLLHLHAEKQARRKTNVVLGLESKTRSGKWDAMRPYDKTRNKLTADDDQDSSKGRFWISIEDAYTVHVVYYTHERHIKPIMAEKTEVVLHITEILAKLNLRLHGDDSGPSPPSRSGPLRIDTAEEALSRLDGPQSSPSLHAMMPSRGEDGATKSLPNLDRFRRNLSDNSGIRQRRQQSSII